MFAVFSLLKRNMIHLQPTAAHVNAESGSDSRGSVILTIVYFMIHYHQRCVLIHVCINFPMRKLYNHFQKLHSEPNANLLKKQELILKELKKKQHYHSLIV